MPNARTRPDEVVSADVVARDVGEAVDMILGGRATQPTRDVGAQGLEAGAPAA